ncbi:nucleotide exchange factor GrpE [Candidatus Collierbacteria bacterium]|nr:nucleotide exchange factor GrpE [Candidatus Collierbacteria bacterium]
MTKKQSDNQQIKQFESRINELDGNWKRALADYKNLEARTEKAVREALTFGTKGLIIKLLKVLDELSMAVEHHPDQTWAKLTRDEMKTILIDEGIVEIEALGKPFNPIEMECVGKAEGEENIVVEIVQKGYKIYDQILRPARVEVGETKNKKQEAKNNESQ